MKAYTAPSAAQVDQALRRITKTQLRRAFFAGLENPLWVKPLADAGAFRNPPEPVPTEDGYLKDAYWPEIDYLTRVAPETPGPVVDVLLTMSASTNPWVRRGLFEIGASIPADQAARLEPVIRSWKSTGFGWRTDPSSLVGFAVNLIEGGQDNLGRWFAGLILKPARSAGRRSTGLVLEDYWYEQGLPRVAKALGAAGLELVLSWLVAYERSSKHLTKTYDMTHMSRDSIRTATGLSHDVESVLIDAVRDLAIDAMCEDPTAAKNVLLGNGMILSRKIALFSLSTALEREGLTPEVKTQLLAVANDMLLDGESVGEGCLIDYAELARALARVQGGQIEELSQVFESGPRIDADRIREWVHGESTDEAEVDERVRNYIDRWKHRWLSAIGTDALPVRLRSELAELDSRYGVIEEPLAPTMRIQGWTGPNSPLSQDEMSAMSPNELAAHLESWHYSGDGWGPEPSHEGQGRELSGLLTTNPTALKGLDDLIDRLRPTYVRAVLQGWEGALKAGVELDWAQVVSFTRQVLAHADESDFPVEGRRDWDDDLTYRPAKQAAVGLLEEIVQKRSTLQVPPTALAEVASSLLNLSSDEAWAEYAGEGNNGGMDALTASLNWQWTTQLRGLVHLVTHGKGTPWFGAAQSALERELERDDPWGASGAVIGEGLGRLSDVDPDWVASRATEWFGSSDGLSAKQQIALTTAMAIHYYHPKLYSLLSLPMIGAINSTEPIIAGWNTHSDPVQRIGEWVIDAIIRGHKSIDDPVAQTFFEAAPAKARGEALGRTAWSFMHADKVDDEIRDRLAGLWDQREAHVRSHPEDHEELRGFFWFVKSKRFAAEWWLPRLGSALELDPGLSAERYMIGKELGQSSQTDPKRAYNVLKLLLSGRDEAGLPSYDLNRRAVPVILARALVSGDESLRAEATAYMNHLGEQGYLTLEDEVRREVEGTDTTDDVDD